MLLLTAGVVALVILSRSGRRTDVPLPATSPVEVVQEVAGRHGCPPDLVTLDHRAPDTERPWVITVHAPTGFPTQRFVLDLEAAAHNLGGRLEPRPLSERGGYGLAHLEGTIGGETWRVLVLGEAPPARATVAPARAGIQPRLAIVLDDAGNALDPLPEIRRLPAEIAVAVLPNAQYSARVANALAADGREIIVHMPMEPVEGGDPGPGPDAVEVSLTHTEIVARLDRALAVVQGARGLNNHMGSRATADEATMQTVMDWVAGNRLYFIDSRTTPDTVAERVAVSRGVSTLRRDVFLDVVADPEAIRQALRKAVSRARGAGHAVAIGHVHPLTLEVLRADLAAALDGVALVRPSELTR